MDYKKFHFEEDELLKIFHHFECVSEKFVKNIPVKSKDMGMNIKKNSASFSSSSNITSNNMHIKKDMGDSSSIGRSKASKALLGKSNLSKSTFSNNENAKTTATQKYQFNEQLFKYIDRMNYMKLNEKFIKNEEIINELCNITAEELIRPDILLDNKKQNNRIFIYDLETNTRKYLEWSASDVLQLPDDFNKYQIYNKIIFKLQNFDTVIWHEK